MAFFKHNPETAQRRARQREDKIARRENAKAENAVRCFGSRNKELAAALFLNNRYQQFNYMTRPANPDALVDGIPLICHAASRNDVVMLEALADARAKDQKDELGRNAFIHAILRGCPADTSAVEFLYRRHFSFDYSDANGQTVLHHLALLAADPLDDASTLLHARFFLAHAPEGFIDRRDNAGKTALHLAVQSRSQTFAEELLIQRADRSIQDNNGATALHLAAENSQSNLCMLLASGGGASLDALDAQGLTPSAAARKSGQASIASIIDLFRPEPQPAAAPNPHASASASDDSTAAAVYLASRDLIQIFGRPLSGPELATLVSLPELPDQDTARAAFESLLSRPAALEWNGIAQAMDSQKILRGALIARLLLEASPSLRTTAKKRLADFG